MQYECGVTSCGFLRFLGPLDSGFPLLGLSFQAQHRGGLQDPVAAHFCAHAICQLHTKRWEHLVSQPAAAHEHQFAGQVVLP